MVIHLDDICEHPLLITQKFDEVDGKRCEVVGCSRCNATFDYTSMRQNYILLRYYQHDDQMRYVYFKKGDTRYEGIQL